MFVSVHCISLLLLIAALGGASAREFYQVFTEFESKKHCGADIRIPQTVWTGTHLIAYGQCREGPSTSRAQNGTAASSGQLGDDLRDSRIIQKVSTDGGLTWTNLSFPNPSKKRGFGSNGCVYDSRQNQVLCHVCHFTNPSQEIGLNYYQGISTDNGQSYTWTNITETILGICGHHGIKANPVMNAGNKIQTTTGRIIFPYRHGWSHHGDKTTSRECLVMSDNSGASWFAGRGQPIGNEASVAEGASPGHIIMNGRGAEFSWYPHRARYDSFDNGQTWNVSKSPLTTAAPCEGSLMNPFPGTEKGFLLFSNPTTAIRTFCVVMKTTSFNASENDWHKLTDLVGCGLTPYGYSVLAPFNDTHGVAVFETNRFAARSYSTFLSQIFSYDL